MWGCHTEGRHSSESQRSSGVMKICRKEQPRRGVEAQMGLGVCPIGGAACWKAGAWFKYLYKRVPDHSVRPEQGEEGISCNWVAWNEVLWPRKEDEEVTYWRVGESAMGLTSTLAMLKPYSVLFSKGGCAQRRFSSSVSWIIEIRGEFFYCL